MCTTDNFKEDAIDAICNNSYNIAYFYLSVNGHMDYSFIGPNHIRAARGWLWWNLDEIEVKSGISRGAVSKFETGKQGLSLKTRGVLYETFLAAGVELLPEGLKARDRK